MPGAPIDNPSPQWNPGLNSPYPLGRPPRQKFVINFKALAIFVLLFAGTVFTTWWFMGWDYSLALLLILGTHEFGHYWACRQNDVDASLPNFIPAPPFFWIGTFGAFIVMREPIPNRRALMEIGASGPIAGFLMAIPVLAYGLAHSEVVALPPGPGGGLGISFGNSLGFIMMAQWILGIDPSSNELTLLLHPVAYAGWLGFFFTALNLLPLGQLDGGHVLYAMFGRNHVWVARAFFGLLLFLGFYSLGWYVWVVLILFLGMRHPPLINEEIPLSPFHRKVGYGCILIFIFTFVPVPIDAPITELLTLF